KNKYKLNLGLAPVVVEIKKDVVIFNETTIPVKEIKKTRLEEDSLYLIDLNYNDIQKIQLYSEETNQYYRLVNCGNETPPTVEISGVKMHVTKGQDPQIDTKQKISTLSALYGNILDTCCGLGYTAINSAVKEKVKMVTTVEIDPNMQMMCQLNPYSKALYQNEKINVIMGDSSQLVNTFPETHFNFIFHDPPRYSLAPALYTVEFYAQLHRILNNKGEVYHYTGEPNKGVRKKSLQIKTMERMQNAGFSEVYSVYQGVWGRK
ncbi:MAG: methyltransferase, partial [Calditrichia bacterium]|nr:methyltransferase [Calditrichia bacterium]